MQRYEKYKDSGVDWLGEIPEHWVMKSNKFVFQLVKNQVGKRSNDYDLLSLTLRGVVKRDMENPEGKFPAEFDTYQEVKAGEFVFCLFDVEETPRTVGLSSFDGMITGAYTVMKPNRGFYAPFYYHYYLNADNKKQLKYLYKGLRNTIPKESFRSLKSITPPLYEQEAIANFLNDKCEKIEAAIGLKEQQIEKLKELRQITINNAVTKGVPHSEVEAVQMKYSGIDWIGELPKNWEVRRLKNVFSLGKGLTITKEHLKELGVLVVNYGEIHSKYGFELDPKKHKLKYVADGYLDSNKSSLLTCGDFVFADTSEDIAGSGNFTYLNSHEKVFAGYHTVIASPKVDLCSRFFAYEFDCTKFRNQVRNGVKGVKVFSITQSILKDLFVWIPKTDEQEQIVAYLDEQTSKIDKAISQKQAQIVKLKEYKQSLINEVVTGKVKVTI